ncbi:hypothetical protein Tel_03305 [Candidatus Tenderia electrophaga]|jgi:hypothetical protein|uniref:Carboxysome shell protein n=1 Tax=Candidatus Tenderia electrophaga TaxID=1748243 RepID=A0A0S2TAR6_9GAMM|nr:hypothetical protein Tel_03305 [Candidatus Tenderia electrophaga]
MAQQTLSGRAASLARRQAQVHGKAALPPKGSGAKASAPQAAASRPAASAGGDSGRDAARARRRAMATHGKAAAQSGDRQRMVDTMRHARQQTQGDKGKDCGCGCGGSGECDKQAAAASPGDSQRSPQSKSQSKPLSTSAAAAKPMPRRREVKPVTAANAGRLNARMRRLALARHGKNGVDATAKGMNSAQLVKQQNPDISGRELARSVRAQRACNGAQGKTRSAPVGRQRPPRPADDVTGTHVGHSTKTTGSETGLCRSITGTEYFSGAVFSEFCQGQPPQAPRKVDVTTTLRGGQVTSGGRVGRASHVTGDERGSCRNVTGNEYVGREQYDDFCPSRPEPGSAKVSHSQTSRGQIVSGSKPARSERVTGDEAGTCKAVTGTPYAGAEQYKDYCAPDQARLAETRSQRRPAMAGRDITGLQPGLGGLTGAEKGACEPVSGTGYIGAAERQAVCGTAPAQPGEADFPQSLAAAPWGAFSVVAPGHATQGAAEPHGVTGTRYEQGRISGTFSLAEGKITGTEQFRFGERQGRAAEAAQAVPAAASQSARGITGEGIDTGLKITGDDWDRGDRVTGTEGMSAVKRNPTRRGPVSAMPAHAPKRNEDLPQSELLVTGGSGNSDKGAAVTVSGGARG